MLIDLFVPVAHAQEAAQGAPNPLVQFAPLLIVFGIFYFLMIRPQKKRLDEEKKMIDQLSKGDEIYTKSGIIGKITGLTEKIMTLEVSDGVKVKVLRSQVGGPAQSLFEKKEPQK
jgi:preprotein translocase subunit YajC